MALRLAQREVGAAGFDDLGRGILMLPQVFDKPFGPGSQSPGVATRLLALSTAPYPAGSTAKSPEPDASVACRG
jgi:hypothetical protein